MKEVLLVVDIQPSFNPPIWLIERAQLLADRFHSIATVEHHDESIVPFLKQLGWAPEKGDPSLIRTDQVFVKHGYRPTEETLQAIQNMNPDRVLVCGIQAETCVLAAGFALFDLGLQPTLIADAVVGSSLDRSGKLGIKLWQHHFKEVVASYKTLLAD